MLKSILKRVLPGYVTHLLVQAKRRSFMSFLAFFASHPRLSTLYYLVFSVEFDREHQAVLSGRLRYLREHNDFNLDSSAMLRRNVHRLEKGLIMQPRRPVFAMDYIGETVTTFAEIANKKGTDRDELQWATDVLAEYFDAVTENPTIVRAKRRFMPYASAATKTCIPYTDVERVKSDIETTNLEKLFKQRRSTRWFAAQPVEQDKLDKAIELASWAPSACNRQPYEFYIFNGPEGAVEVAKMAVGTGGFANNIPCIMAVVGNLSAYPHEKDRHLIYIDGSLAAMQLMLAFETMGLASCPLNWPDVDKNEQQITAHLELTADKRVIMLIAVGYAKPDGGIPFSQKKSSATLSKTVNR